jgi:hypothetical protein
MSEIVNNTGQTALAEDLEEIALEGRLWRSMFVVVTLAVIISALLAPWRVTTGLLLGGLLSFFNHHWLRTSIRAVFSSSGGAGGVSSRLVAARYVLRYAIIALVIASAYILDLISLGATLVGMCAFVAAIMIEAMVLLFRAIVYGGGD